MSIRVVREGNVVYSFPSYMSKALTRIILLDIRRMYCWFISCLYLYSIYIIIIIRREATIKYHIIFPAFVLSTLVLALPKRSVSARERSYFEIPQTQLLRLPKV